MLLFPVSVRRPSLHSDLLAIAHLFRWFRPAQLMPGPREDAPDKDTVALDEDELDILDAIRRAAPKHHIDQKLAQTYGVWTVCFRRYCRETGVPWLWMSSVSDFMDFLDKHPKVSAPERNRALDGIMFYITDVHKKRKEGETSETDRSSDVPRSTQSLFAKMLLRCDVRLTEALQLRFEDVDVDERSVTLPGGAERNTRTVSLPDTLNKGLKHHLQRVEDRTDTTNPFLFGRRREATGDTGSTETEIERSTELATRVMQTFGEDLADEE